MLPAVLAWLDLSAGKVLAPAGSILWFAVLCGARLWYVGGTDVGFSFVDTPVRYSESALTRALSYLLQHGRYGQLLVLPWNMSWDYSYDALPLIRSFGDVRVLSILTTYAAAAAVVAWAAAVRSGPMILAVGLIVIPFVPCSNIFFLVGTTVAERLMYPSTTGWALLVSAVGSHLASRGGTKRRVGSFQSHQSVNLPAIGKPAALCNILFPLCCCILVIAYGSRAGFRMWQWRTRVSLFYADMKVWHRSAKVTHQFASLLHGGGRYQEALVYYDRSLQIHDDNAVTDYCVARIQMELGRHTEASARFEKILLGHGIGFAEHNRFLLHIDYGWLLVRMGEPARATPILANGLRLRPDLAYAWNALGVAQARAGDLQAAMASLVNAVGLQPKNPLVWSNAAAVAAIAGAREQASDAIRNALALAPWEANAVWNARILFEGALQQPSLELFLDPTS